MKLSVIVPTHNRLAILRKSVPRLLAQNFPAEECELLYVLDACSDGSEGYLQDCTSPFPLRVLHSPSRGPSAARNAGIQAACGELVLFLDDDLLCRPDHFRRHCEAHTGNRKAVVHGPIYIAPESAPTLARYHTERFYEEYYRTRDSRFEFSYPSRLNAKLSSVLSSLANSSVPREALLHVGGFDEGIFAAEDLELGLRLWKMGLVFCFAPAAEVREYYQKSSHDYLRLLPKALAPGEVQLLRKHPEYRPCATLAGFAEARTSRRWLRDAVLRSPFFPMALLTAPLRLERFYSHIPSLRQAGLWLFQFAEKVTRLRASLRAMGSWRTVRQEFDRVLPVLCYHLVGPQTPGVPEYLNVSAANFERQLRWLKRHNYTAIHTADWQRWLDEGRGLPEKPVLITFDDAYHCTASIAFPLLQKYGFTATVFTVTARIGATNTWDEAKGFPALPLMTSDEIRRWNMEGIEFGAHSRTHTDLVQATPSECLAEVRGSREELASLLGHPVTSFAYPYGNWNEGVRQVCQHEFDLALCSQEGLNYLRTDRHCLRRIYVGPYDTIPEFAWSVRHGGLGGWRRWRGHLGLHSRLRHLSNVLGRNRK